MMKCYYERVQIVYWDGKFHSAYIGRVHNTDCGDFSHHMHDVSEQLAHTTMKRIAKLANSKTTYKTNPYDDVITSLEITFFRAW